MGDDTPPPGDLPQDVDEKLKAESEKLIAELSLLIERAKTITEQHRRLLQDFKEAKKRPRK